MKNNQVLWVKYCTNSCCIHCCATPVHPDAVLSLREFGHLDPDVGLASQVPLLNLIVERRAAGAVRKSQIVTVLPAVEVAEDGRVFAQPDQDGEVRQGLIPVVAGEHHSSSAPPLVKGG